jgi:O-antigen ligase
MQVATFFREHPLGSKIPTIAIILITLAYCALVAYIFAQGRQLIAIGLIALPILAASAVFAVQRFELLVLALPITALAIPFDLPTGTQTRLSFSMMLALGLTSIWFISMFLRGWKIAPSPLNKPMLAFAITMSISLIWGQFWRDPILLSMSGNFFLVQAASLVCYLVSISASLLIGNFYNTPARLKYLVGCFLVFCTITTLAKLLRLPFDFLTGKGLWALWLVAPAYGILIAQPNLKRRWIWSLIVILSINLYLTVIHDSFWVSGWLPSIVCIYAITFLRSKRLFAVLVIVGCIVFFFTQSFFQTVAQENIDDGSLERLSLWEQNWQIVSQHWLFGTGPAGYAIYYMTYFRDDARSTHNNYLDILAQFGFVGMGMWIWLSITALIEGMRLIRETAKGFLHTLAIIATGGWLGALAAMFLGDWVLPFAYNQTLGGYKYTVFSWLFLGTLISIRQLVNKQQTEHLEAEHA